MKWCPQGHSNPLPSRVCRQCDADFVKIRKEEREEELKYYRERGRLMKTRQAYNILETIENKVCPARSLSPSLSSFSLFSLCVGNFTFHQMAQLEGAGFCTVLLSLAPPAPKSGKRSFRLYTILDSVAPKLREARQGLRVLLASMTGQFFVNYGIASRERS